MVYRSWNAKYFTIRLVVLLLFRTLVISSRGHEQALYDVCVYTANAAGIMAAVAAASQGSRVALIEVQLLMLYHSYDDYITITSR